MSLSAAVWLQFSMHGFDLLVAVSRKRSVLSNDNWASCFYFIRSDLPRVKVSKEHNPHKSLIEYFTRDNRYAKRVLAFVRSSVCPSVTHCSPIRTVQARITKSSPWAATGTLVLVTNFCAAG